MLEPGATVPDVHVWTAPREEPVLLSTALAGGAALLCFYVFDWSPG
jgi:hypothetical protein